MFEGVSGKDSFESMPEIVYRVCPSFLVYLSKVTVTLVSHCSISGEEWHMLISQAGFLCLYAKFQESQRILPSLRHSENIVFLIWLDRSRDVISCLLTESLLSKWENSCAIYSRNWELGWGMCYSKLACPSLLPAISQSMRGKKKFFFFLSHENTLKKVHSFLLQRKPHAFKGLNSGMFA